ncbi:leucine Rich repeat-containing domain protein, partial [Clostridiales bacterium KA00134]
MEVKMKESKKRIMGLFLSLAMLITCLPLNPIATYAAEGDVAINNENFPDYYFRDYVSRQLDTNHDNILSQEECDKVANISVVRGYDSLKGIEHFKKLKSLNCSENGLMDTLDLSQNPALEELTCKEIGIKALDLSQNKALKKLNCEGSSWLETLNLGSKPALEELNCYKCPITALDLSQSPRLKNVNCSENQLTELKLGSNSDLETLECSNNQLTELDVRKCPKLTALWFKKNQLRTIDLSNNTALIKLGFGFNKIEKIDLSANTSLEWVGGYNNPLTSLKIPDKTYKNKNFSPITYSVKVQSGGSKVSFVVLPQGFDKNRIQGTVTGASVQGDSFTWDRSTKPITFKYQLCDKPKEVVEAQITVTEGKAIKNTYNLDEMPEDGYERLTFKSGDGNFIGLGKVYAIDVLRGTSYDDLGLKKQIKSIEGDLRPTDKKKEFDKWDKQVPATGNVATETFTAVYKDKDVVKLSNDPISPTPSGYTRIIFDAGDGNTIDGNRYKIIDVLENTRWDDAALRKQIPSKAIYKDASKEFKEWRYEVPTSGKVSRRSFTATYKDGKKVVLPNQENPGEVVKGRVRITFDAGEGNTIDGTHRYKYIDVLEKTNWYETDLKAQIPSVAKYKDASKEFYKWKEQVPTSGRVSTKTFTATYKDGKKVVLPNPTSPGKVVKGRVRITFDAGEGNTIDGTHRYKYIDVLENTPWTNTILIRQIPSKTTSKDTTKEFDKWNEQVPTTGNVETKTFTAIYKEKVFDPANVTSMVVKTQPTKLSYTEGEKLDLAGLEVTLKDNQGLTKDVVFADFTANGITAEPENDTALSVADTGKGIKLTKESLTAETNALIVNIDQAKLAAATTLVEAAENSKAEADYNAAKTAVEALTDSDGKAKLQKRLEEVQKYIDANNAIEALKQK